MFKKSIRFENFDGETVEKDFYFHMSKSELIAMVAGGNAFLQHLERIIAEKDAKGILKEFRDIIEASCGMRSEDGQRFLKTPEAQSQLLDSPAYDELLMELCTSANAAADFVRQLVPEKMQQEVKAQLEKAPKTATETDIDPFKQPAADDPRPGWMKEERNPTPEELRNMTAEELRLAFQHRK